IAAVIKATGYIEAPDCTAAIAAAEVVAALRGHAAPDLPPEAVKFVAQKPALDPVVVKDATAAVSRVLAGSELKDLWDDSQDSKAWADGLRSLLQRLTA